MSKESYARGFVKAAAAAGVDPTELAKFAQATNNVNKGNAPLLETGGRAPASVVQIGTGAVPAYAPGGEGMSLGHSGYFTTGRAKPVKSMADIVSAAQMGHNIGDSLDSLMSLHDTPDWYKNWLKAHRIASDSAASPIAEFVRDAMKKPDFNEELMKKFVSDESRGAPSVDHYHRAMNLLTNGIPASASAPITKK